MKYLRRSILAVFGCLLATLSAVALAQPAAWRIASDAGELLLLGSVHLLREEDHPLPPLIEQLYQRAEVLVMELGAEDLDPVNAQLPMTMAAMLPAGRSLSDVLTGNTWALAERRAAELGVALMLFERFKPWMVALTIMELKRMRHGYRADLGIEQHLLAKANADGKPVLGLETLQTQIAVFDSLSFAEQEAILEQTLRELDEADATMSVLIEAWQDGRIDALAYELVAELDDFPQLRDALIADRNADWVPKIEALIGDGRRYLIVVGALHLAGPGNVIELLTERGHAAERIE
jgi:uncharacterized protein